MFNDPALYDNMTGLTGDLRLLIADFRKIRRSSCTSKWEFSSGATVCGLLPRQVAPRN